MIILLISILLLPLLYFVVRCLTDRKYATIAGLEAGAWLYGYSKDYVKFAQLQAEHESASYQNTSSRPTWYRARNPFGMNFSERDPWTIGSTHTIDGIDGLDQYPAIYANNFFAGLGRMHYHKRWGNRKELLTGFVTYEEEFIDEGVDVIYGNRVGNTGYSTTKKYQYSRLMKNNHPKHEYIYPLRSLRSFYAVIFVTFIVSYIFAKDKITSFFNWFNYEVLKR